MRRSLVSSISLQNEDVGIDMWRVLLGFGCGRLGLGLLHFLQGGLEDVVSCSTELVSTLVSLFSYDGLGDLPEPMPMAMAMTPGMKLPPRFMACAYQYQHDKCQFIVILLLFKTVVETAWWLIVNVVDRISEPPPT